jgi:nicotinamidase-related amidase
MRLPCDAVLLLIDLQQTSRVPSFDPADYPDAKAEIAALLDAWRAESLPIVHVRRESADPASLDRLGLETQLFLPRALPRDGETILGRSDDSAFAGTDLEAALDGFGATTLVVCGILGNPSLAASVRDGANLGYRLFVVADACGSTGEGEEFSLAPMQDEMAEIVDCATTLRAAAMANIRRKKP